MASPKPNLLANTREGIVIHVIPGAVTFRQSCDVRFVQFSLRHAILAS